jgi:hypothetical protein
VNTLLRKLFPERRLERLWEKPYVNSICSGATKLFALLLCHWGISRDILKLIEEGISDTDLPFTRVYQNSRGYTLAKKEHDSGDLKDHQACVIKTFSTWRAADLVPLLREQWMVLSPVFGAELPGVSPHYEFEHWTILPFVEDQERVEGGMKYSGYSESWTLRIHPAHQNIILPADPSV